jgi:hypothetical protein
LSLNLFNDALNCISYGVEWEENVNNEEFSLLEYTANGLHGVISQKIELFITTAVRTSNPA